MDKGPWMSAGELNHLEVGYVTFERYIEAKLSTSISITFYSPLIGTRIRVYPFPMESQSQRPVTLINPNETLTLMQCCIL